MKRLIFMLIICLFIVGCASTPEEKEDNKVIGTTPDGTPIITMPM